MQKRQTIQKLILLVLIFLNANLINSQDWEFRTNNNNIIDGKFIATTTIGSGEFPYTDPMFVINYSTVEKIFNIYVTDVNSTLDCGNLTIAIGFDKTEKILKYENCETCKNNQSWFIPYSTEIINQIKINDIMQIRLINDCETNDYFFSLNGSSKTINHFYNEVYKLK